jgi:hypothetical protein
LVNGAAFGDFRGDVTGAVLDTNADHRTSKMK